MYLHHSVQPFRNLDDQAGDLNKIDMFFLILLVVVECLVLGSGDHVNDWSIGEF